MNADALAEAAAKVGGRPALARLLGISRQAVEQWHEVPMRRVLEVERWTGVPRTRLRPDIYPRETPRLRRARLSEARA